MTGNKADAVALLPCPFCGSNDVDADGWSNTEGVTGPACNNCGACAGEVSKNAADNIAAWNTRTPPSAPACAPGGVNETLLVQVMKDAPMVRCFHINPVGGENIEVEGNDWFCHLHEVKAYKKWADKTIASARQPVSVHVQADDLILLMHDAMYQCTGWEMLSHSGQQKTRKAALAIVKYFILTKRKPVQPSVCPACHNKTRLTPRPECAGVKRQHVSVQDGVVKSVTISSKDHGLWPDAQDKAYKEFLTKTTTTGDAEEREA